MQIHISSYLWLFSHNWGLCMYTYFPTYWILLINACLVDDIWSTWCYMDMYMYSSTHRELVASLSQCVTLSPSFELLRLMLGCTWESMCTATMLIWPLESCWRVSLTRRNMLSWGTWERYNHIIKRNQCPLHISHELWCFKILVHSISGCGVLLWSLSVDSCMYTSTASVAHQVLLLKCLSTFNLCAGICELPGI